MTCAALPGRGWGVPHCQDIALLPRGGEPKSREAAIIKRPERHRCDVGEMLECFRKNGTVRTSGGRSRKMQEQL